MGAQPKELADAMPVTSRYPDLGVGPIDVKPLIDGGLFELERDRIFKNTWLMVARTEELPDPGDFKVRDLPVARTSVIIVRDKSGQINAFHNICTHRGNKLISEHGDQCLGRPSHPGRVVGRRHIDTPQSIHKQQEAC